MRRTRHQLVAGELVTFTESIGLKSILHPETYICQVIEPGLTKSTVQIMSALHHRGTTMQMKNSALSKFSPVPSLPFLDEF